MRLVSGLFFAAAVAIVFLGFGSTGSASSFVSPYRATHTTTVPVHSSAEVATSSSLASDGANAISQRIWGDTYCDDQLDFEDPLDVLGFVVGFISFANCGPVYAAPVISSVVTVDGLEVIWGDVSCNGSIDVVDALFLLRFIAELPVPDTAPCPAIGASVNIGFGPL